MNKLHFSPPILIALVAAFLFGASTPFAKHLLAQLSPQLLAGLLYSGSGIGLMSIRIIRDKRWLASGLTKAEWLWFAGAIFFGGILAPVLLMLGLVYTSAASASLLLNLEAVFTALFAWLVFKENTDRRIVLGMLFIVAGGVVLAWPSHNTLGSFSWGPIFIVAACLSWAIDNNLTRHVSAQDALFIAGNKGLIAGVVNVLLALSLGAILPSWQELCSALSLGFFAYGISLVCFVLALRHLGTARTGAYFSTAPFIGAVIAIIFFHDVTTFAFWLATVLMALGVWLHLTEYHEHEHTHEPLFHSHRHGHDEHHQHTHDFPWDGKEPHTHPHHHEPMTHTHRHYPDIHHRHKH
jgi:drug/metabolite transporter (DMT)-like permease